MRPVVKVNRLRRFGWSHDFLDSLFLLNVRCPNLFFVPDGAKDKVERLRVRDLTRKAGGGFETGDLIDSIAFSAYRAPSNCAR